MRRREGAWEASYSRNKLFNQCPRQWLMQYQPHRLPGRIGDIVEQGKLAPWATLTGKVVDTVICEALLYFRDHGRWPARIQTRTHQVLREALTASRDAIWYMRNGGLPLKQVSIFQALDRHYYPEEPTPAEVDAVLQRAVECVENFARSDVRRLIESTPPAQWWGPRAPDAPPPSFWLDRIKVWAVPDFALRTDAGVQIIDWKTGRSDPLAYSEAIEQLHWYALYAVHEWGGAPDRITLSPVFLHPTAWTEPFPVRAQELERLEVEIRARHALLTELLQPGDSFALEDWPMAAERWRCPSCVFRGACEGAQRPMLRSPAAAFAA